MQRHGIPVASSIGLIASPAVTRRIRLRDGNGTTSIHCRRYNSNDYRDMPIGSSLPHHNVARIWRPTHLNGIFARRDSQPPWAMLIQLPEVAAVATYR